MAQFKGITYPYTRYTGETLEIPIAYCGGAWTYIVQSGDSLFSIGNQYGLPWQALADANILSYPYVIYTGETLLIPSTSPPQDVLAVNDPCSWWWGCQTNKYDSLILEYSN